MTFSIVARDADTGDLGVAVTTGVACVGALAPHASLQGAICTQAFVNVDLALRAMQLLDLGTSISGAMSLVLEEDPGADMRQVIAIGADGTPFAHTGTKPLGWAGHRIGDGYVVAGNSLVGEMVLDAMVDRYTSDTETEFTLRLIRAIAAGQAAGGEREVDEVELHVQNSAAAVVASHRPRAFHNLRVDAATDAVAELLRVHDAARVSAEALEDFYGGSIVIRPLTWRIVRGPAGSSGT